uniref:Uncharacterized protein n=1 Tax=viral metagenome TaxID=1070528 RepID=A0A6C0J5P3_9ZZZZ
MAPKLAGRRRTRRGGASETQLNNELEEIFDRMGNNPCASESPRLASILKGANNDILASYRDGKVYEGFPMDFILNIIGSNARENLQLCGTREVSAQFQADVRAARKIHAQLSALVIERGGLNKQLVKKATDQAVRDVVEKKMGIDASPGTGPADNIRGFLGVQPPKRAGRRRRYTRRR